MNKKYRIILTIVLVIIITFDTGFLIYKTASINNYKDINSRVIENKNASFNKATSSANIEASSTRTVKWLTYKRKDEGFEFQYPSDWEVKGDNVYSGKTGTLQTFVQKETNATVLSIEYEGVISSTLKEYVQSEIKQNDCKTKSSSDCSDCGYKIIKEDAIGILYQLGCIASGTDYFYIIKNESNEIIKFRILESIENFMPIVKSIKKFKPNLQSNYHINEIFVAGHFNHKGNVYRDDYYGFELALPDDWLDFKTQTDIYSDKEDNYTNNASSDILNKIIKVNSLKEIKNLDKRYAEITFFFPLKKSYPDDRCSLIGNDYNHIVDACKTHVNYFGLPELCSSFKEKLDLCDDGSGKMFGITIVPIEDIQSYEDSFLNTPYPLAEDSELGRNDKFVFFHQGVTYGTLEGCGEYDEDTRKFMETEADFCAAANKMTNFDFNENFKLIK